MSIHKGSGSDNDKDSKKASEKHADTPRGKIPTVAPLKTKFAHESDEDDIPITVEKSDEPETPKESPKAPKVKETFLRDLKASKFFHNINTENEAQDLESLLNQGKGETGLYLYSNYGKLDKSETEYNKRILGFLYVKEEHGISKYDMTISDTGVWLESEERRLGPFQTLNEMETEVFEPDRNVGIMPYDKEKIAAIVKLAYEKHKKSTQPIGGPDLGDDVTIKPDSTSPKSKK